MQNKYSDLWKYSPLSNTWTWVTGPNTLDVTGIYGTQNVASPGVFPGGRHGSGTWVDNNGNFWLFGGRGFGFSGQGRLSDFWKYDPANNQWAWMGGSQSAGTAGVFGTLSAPAPANAPGARDFPATWLSPGGKLLLFGGQGYASTAAIGLLNDFWEYNISSGLWTWIGGQNIINQFGVYGIQGIASAGTLPGARVGTASWVDATGHYWLFGGQGFATTGSASWLNDLFRFDPSTNQWTWMKVVTSSIRSPHMAHRVYPLPPTTLARVSITSGGKIQMQISFIYLVVSALQASQTFSRR